MGSLGVMPEYISSLSILESMGENIIIADTTFNIVWVNPKAAD
ncbi:MAG: hypothetical protein Q8906_01955 [Bacillota bacterium]|nr:hypothetical protein [Bacillota bacterium]